MRGSPRYTRRRLRSAAGSSWRATALGAASTSISRYPLPDLIEGLRTALYPLLADIANRWNEALGSDGAVSGGPRGLPRSLPSGRADPAHAADAQYTAGDYNCLHQDLYGEHVFPLQVAFLLSSPGRDFTGASSC